MTIFMIDISAYQGEFDVAQAGREGYAAVICKATEGVTYRDPRFDTLIPAVRSAKMIPGGYHYLRAGNGAAQARSFHSRITDHGGPNGWLCACDNEADASWSATQAFFAEWERLTSGHPLIMYSGGWWWKSHGWDGASLTPLLWTSHYVSGTASGSELYAKVPPSWWNPGYGNWQTATILQFTSTARVAGRAPVDADAFGSDLADLLALTRADPNPDVPTTGDDDVQSLMRWTGSDAVILTDGRVGRWVTTTGEIDDLRTLAGESTISLGYNGGIRIVGRRELCGDLVGPRPAEWGPDPVVSAVAAAVGALSAEVQLDDLAVDRVAQAVVTRADNPLGERDKPVIIDAVQDAIRSMIA